MGCNLSLLYDLLILGGRVVGNIQRRGAEFSPAGPCGREILYYLFPFQKHVIPNAVRNLVFQALCVFSAFVGNIHRRGAEGAEFSPAGPCGQRGQCYYFERSPQGPVG